VDGHPVHLWPYRDDDDDDDDKAKSEDEARMKDAVSIVCASIWTYI
jgi:hypothetical protein